MASSSKEFDPPYPDVFADNISDNNDKMCLLSSKWDTVHQFVFPSRYFNGKFRKMQPHWFISNTWLRYSKSAGGVYCAPCHLFAGTVKKSLVSAAATDPSNLGKMITNHTKSDLHINSVEAAENFRSVMNGDKKDILCSMSTSYNAIVEKKRQILKAIVETIVLCGQQNLSLRGHDDERGNFKALLEYQAKYNTVLNDHLINGDPRTKYTSPDIQNELIEICGQQIKTSIVQTCNNAPFFGFIADEATDASTMEQMALCLRYFDYDTRAVREDFIAFAECSATTGEALSEAFLRNLRAAGVDICKMRGQGYDGASNMSGKYRGVQARIRQELPRAVYTHCKAHCLNLAIVHASKEPLARNMMTTVQEVAFAFNYSAKRLLRYQETLVNDAESRVAMERRTKLQSLCETRWAARADALNTFRCSYTTVVESLDDLCMNYGDTKAGSYKLAITQFGFVVNLVAIEHVLSGLVPLSQMLQHKSCDLVEAVKEAKTVARQVTEERNDPVVWDALYTTAVEMADSVDVQPERPRGRNNHRQQHRQNAPAESISDYWKRNMYFPFVDHLAVELSDRLIEDGERFNAQFLVPSELGQLTEERIESIYDAFVEDLPGQDVEEFKREVYRWKARHSGAVDTEPPTTLGDTLANANRELYPNVTTCLHILLAMPVSTATAERSFSSMRRLKTYLRSTMTTGRLSGLGLMNIHRDRDIDTNRVIDAFARKKDRRLALLFHV